MSIDSSQRIFKLNISKHRKVSCKKLKNQAEDDVEGGRTQNMCAKNSTVKSVQKWENCTKDKLECLDVKYDYYTMTCIYEFYGQIYTNK